MRAQLVDRRGLTGGAYLHIHPGLQLTSPACYTRLPGHSDVGHEEYVTAGTYRAYLERYARHHGLSARQAEVLAVRRCDDAFEVDLEAGGRRMTQRHGAVVVATGMYDFPRWPRIPGLPAPGPTLRHARDWAGPDEHRGRTVAIIGGATSAIEIAESLARAGAHPVVCARRVRVLPRRFLGRDLHDFAVLLEAVPRWLLGSYCDRRPTLPATDLGFRQLVREGRIRVAGAPERFEGSRIVVRGGEVIAPDVTICATGYDFAVPFLPPGVPRAEGGHPLADGGESRAWPGLFFVGFPCARSLASEFLRGIASDAPAVAERIRRRGSRPAGSPPPARPGR